MKKAWSEDYFQVALFLKVVKEQLEKTDGINQMNLFGVSLLNNNKLYIYAPKKGYIQDYLRKICRETGIKTSLENKSIRSLHRITNANEGYKGEKTFVETFNDQTKAKVTIKGDVKRRTEWTIEFEVTKKIK